ncbi:MAG: hypothetical protein U0793_27000 [Gemmataceae bacterium]
MLEHDADHHRRVPGGRLVFRLDQARHRIENLHEPVFLRFRQRGARPFHLEEHELNVDCHREAREIGLARLAQQHHLLDEQWVQHELPRRARIELAQRHVACRGQHAVLHEHAEPLQHGLLVDRRQQPRLCQVFGSLVDVLLRFLRLLALDPFAGGKDAGRAQLPVRGKRPVLAEDLVDPRPLDVCHLAPAAEVPGPRLDPLPAPLRPLVDPFQLRQRPAEHRFFPAAAVPFSDTRFQQRHDATKAIRSLLLLVGGIGRAQRQMRLRIARVLFEARLQGLDARRLLA